MSTKKTNVKKPTTKTYFLDLQNNDVRKVEVPSHWTLTFGPTIPYAGKNTGVPYGTALRFYEDKGKTELRACFTDVKAFRDSSIPVLEKRTKTQHKIMQQQTKQGVQNAEVAVSVTEWVNPDAIDEKNEGKENPLLGLISSHHGLEIKQS